MDYRGIITAGYHVDAGGQNPVRIISKGYIGILSTVLIPDVIRLSSIQLSAPKLKSIIVAKPRMTGITLN